ncbi:Hsp33 family molecular chaperone HslO, partial [Mycetohabitans sp. B6]|uniref:Hsp33 family molecular chaperone HslO n=1 Tax=Mycetohabitans sp. B6 TaxID=2841843 RepID=UPI001EFF6128
TQRPRPVALTNSVSDAVSLNVSHSLPSLAVARIDKSEQLDTRLWLAADERRAVGMLLQKLPGDGGIVPRAVQT